MSQSDLHLPSSVKSPNFWMQKALAAAQKAQRIDDVPVGAVIVMDNKIISTGYNRKEQIHSAIAHAELIAIHKASRKLGAWRLVNCQLYVTLEPCAMCTSALVQARIGHVFFGAFDPKAGACGSVLSLNEHPQLNHQFPVTGGILEKECSELLKGFFKAKRSEKAKKLKEG